MDFKINRENVFSADCIYEGVQEQGIELDYILPDYFPDVFRIVRCEAEPVIADYSINGDRLSYELRCDLKIMYCSETGSVLQCVNQKQTFTKTVELNRICENISVELKPETDYMNCRAVNKRRLDMRGAVSVKIKAVGEKSQEVISDISGLNVKLKKTPVKFASKKITSRKNIQLTEDIELTSLQPSVISIIRCKCIEITCEKKLVSGKLLAKGEAVLTVLYACEKDGEGLLEPMEFSMPYSQIIDLEGSDDSFEFSVKPEIVYCDVSAFQNKEGENRNLRCEAELQLNCTAIKSASVNIGTDAYSTTHPCNVSMTEIKLEQIPTVIGQEIHHSLKMLSGDEIPEKVYYVWCSPKNVNAVISAEEKKLPVSGMLRYTAACRDNSGLLSMPEKEEAFEEIIVLDEIYENASATAEIRINDVSYNLSDGDFTVSADITALVSLCTSASVKAVSDISVDEEVKKIRDGDYSIKLYYGTENEDIWEIAKRYSTSADAIAEENELCGERLEQSGMLIIPIVS